MDKFREYFGVVLPQATDSADLSETQKETNLENPFKPDQVTVIPSHILASNKTTSHNDQFRMQNAIRRAKILVFIKQKLFGPQDIYDNENIQNIEKIDKTNAEKRKRRRRRISMFGTYVECPVCFGQVKKQHMVVFHPTCKHSFCDGCVKEFVQDQIKQFKVVKCPNEECSVTLDENADLIKKCSLQDREKYYKILVLDQINKDPHKRICPNQNCQGYIKINEKPIICVTCGVQYCPKCFNRKHECLCDDNEIDFLEENFNFRQCDRCLFVVEKRQGCNHMTCRCGYGFCYLCGGPRDGVNTHYCRPKKKRVPPPPAAAPNEGVNQGSQAINDDCSGSDISEDF